MRSLFVNPVKCSEETINFLGREEKEGALTIDFYKSQRHGNDLWLISLPQSEMEEIKGSTSLTSHFVTILGVTFEWSTPVILDFWRQSGRLYEITLLDESVFYYAWHSDALQSSITPWSTEKKDEE